MPIISNAEYAKLKAAEAQLKEQQIKELLQPVGKELGRKLAMLCANTSWKDWTDQQKAALDYVTRGDKEYKNLYISRLPSNTFSFKGNQ